MPYGNDAKPKKPGGLSVAIVMGKPKGMHGMMGKGSPAGEDSEEMEGDEPSDDLEASEDELAALKEFESAKSPEDKAKALKAFIKLCVEGGY